MSSVILYLLKSSACTGILLLYYYIALRNKKMHRFNRFYLLGVMIVSIVIPLLQLHWTVRHTAISDVVPVENLLNVINGQGEADSSTIAHDNWLSVYQVSFVMAAAISFFLLIKVQLGIFRVMHLKTRYAVTRKDRFNFIETDLPQAPFSFLNNLFWRNDIDITTPAGKSILAHELTHITQKHTLDRIFAGTVSAIFWMNPFFYLIKKELSAIHEFLADEHAINDSNPQDFALMLLHATPYAKDIFPAHSFFHSSIKRRLLMLTKNKSARISIVRKFMVLPLLAFTIMIFAFRLQEESQGNTKNPALRPFRLVIDAGHGGKDLGAAGINGAYEKDFTLAIAKQLQQRASDYGIDVLMTRESDVNATPQQRVDWIKTQQADACISIHVNSTGTEAQTDSSGFDIYVAKDDANGKLASSKQLGTAVLSSLAHDFKTPASLFQRQAGIWVLQANPLPAILVECGYINNADDYKVLMNKTDIIAKKILEGVSAYANHPVQ